MFAFKRFKCPSNNSIQLFRAKCAIRTSQAPLGAFVIQRGVESEATPRKRTRKTKGQETVVKFEELSQGLISHEPIEDEEAVPDEGFPTVIQQAKNNMRKFEHCVVLTRVGNFYELYFEQAEQYAPLLNIKLAAKKTSMGPVPMAGFPFFQLDRFLKVLVQDLEKHVAISEEMLNDPSKKVKSGGLLFDRQVKRVITPGTLIDEHFLTPSEHNYLLAIQLESTSQIATVNHQGISQLDPSTPVGLSWLDLSSGDFFTQSTVVDSLGSAIARIRPREVVLDKSVESLQNEDFYQIIRQERGLITFYTPTRTMVNDGWMQSFEDVSPRVAAETFTRAEQVSASLLLQYVETQLPGMKLRLQAPIQQRTEEYMIIDRNSLRGLEVTQTLRDGLYKGSLLQAVRRTSTESGARLLAHRLTSPSMSLTVINDRLDLVETLLNNNILLEDLVELLRRTYDMARLVQKFSLGRGDADDLLGLAKTIGLTRNVADLLLSSEANESPCMHRLQERFSFERPENLAKQISEAIDQEGLAMRQRSQEEDSASAAEMARGVIEEEAVSDDLTALRKRLHPKKFVQTSNDSERVPDDEIWIMRRTASNVLERLHEDLDDLHTEKIELASSLRTQLNATSLTLKVTPGLGHICHVKGKDTKAELSALQNARTVSSSKSTRSFYLPEWTKLGGRIENAKMRIRAEEQNIFQDLRERVIRNLVHLRRNAAILDELDVACSFARLATEHNLKRPRLTNNCEHQIWQGRHITVESGLTEFGRTFMPNDCLLSEKENIWLITGPNMAGKSTFLRQTALISILAQTGSFVPAEYAEIGLVDQIFSRVGSADNLSQDQSTFMVEMLETAHILRHATRRSFVIMDEVGRGTTPEDGIAVGYAVLHHLQQENRCRTLFATHFHALAEMTAHFEGVGCFCTDVVEEPDGSFRFDHRLRRGVNRQSHALKVAKMAGMPERAIEVASEVLDRFKQESGVQNGQVETHKRKEKQMSQAGGA